MIVKSLPTFVRSFVKSKTMIMPTSADAVVVPEHGAVLDGSELAEHGLDLLLPHLLAHHPHEDLPLCKF